MGVDRPMDDMGILRESVVCESKSLELFRSTIDDLLENDDPNVRQDADYVKDKLEKGEVAILCDKRLSVRDDEILITQVRSGDKHLPIFILPANLNREDLAKTWPKSVPDFIRNAPYADQTKDLIVGAIQQMAFSLRAVERQVKDSGE